MHQGLDTQWTRSLGPADLLQEGMGLGPGSLSGGLRSPAPLQAGLGLEPDFQEMGGSLWPHKPCTSQLPTDLLPPCSRAVSSDSRGAGGRTGCPAAAGPWCEQEIHLLMLEQEVRWANI